MAGSYNARLRHLETLKTDSEFAFTFAIADYGASGEPRSYQINDAVVDREPGEQLGAFQARIRAMGSAGRIVLIDGFDLEIL